MAFRDSGTTRVVVRAVLPALAEPVAPRASLPSPSHDRARLFRVYSQRALSRLAEVEQFQPHAISALRRSARRDRRRARNEIAHDVEERGLTIDPRVAG